MTVCHFFVWPAGEAPDIAKIEGLIGTIPGLGHALIHTPSTTSDPYLHDGAPPALAVQLYYPSLAALEAASHADSPVAAFGGTPTQQAMLVRRFPVPDPDFTGPGRTTYLVTYEGVAEDPFAWLGYYIAHHPPIMARFPGIRQIEIYTRLDWLDELPFPRVAHLQRNKVVFDSPAALTAALNSPVRHDMRADFHKFPPYTGGNTHFPMETREVG